MGNFYLDENAMLAKIELLKIEKEKIDAVLEKVKGDALSIKDYWSGDTGDAVSDELNEYTNEFDYISSKLQKQITTLEKAVAKYQKMAKRTDDQITQNTETAAI